MILIGLFLIPPSAAGSELPPPPLPPPCADGGRDGRGVHAHQAGHEEGQAPRLPVSVQSEGASACFGCFHLRRPLGLNTPRIALNSLLPTSLHARGGALRLLGRYSFTYFCGGGRWVASRIALKALLPARPTRVLAPADVHWRAIHTALFRPSNPSLRNVLPPPLAGTTSTGTTACSRRRGRTRR